MAVIAGNWKMYLGPAETRAFFQSFALPRGAEAHELIVFPSPLSLPAAAGCPERDPRIALGVQNVHWEDSGAFTGEVSAAMAAEVGATFALVGHSERRHVFGETDRDVALKTEAALRHGLVPVVCVGETLEERRAGRVDEVIVRQMRATLAALSSGRHRFLVAYEPVWAIGTGETATPQDAASAHGTLRACLAADLGEEPGRAVPILYGGSVKPANAEALLAAPDVDGVLVGGASLQPESFASIAAAGTR